MGKIADRFTAKRAAMFVGAINDAKAHEPVPLLVDGFPYGIKTLVFTTHQFILETVAMFSGKFNEQELRNILANLKKEVKVLDKAFDEAQKSGGPHGSVATSWKRLERGRVLFHTKVTTYQEFINLIVDYVALEFIVNDIPIHVMHAAFDGQMLHGKPIPSKENAIKVAEMLAKYDFRVNTFD